MKICSTVVIEDEGPARRRLEAMVNAHPNLELTGSLQSGKEAINLLPQLNPEILLMDIQLKDKNAFEVLDAIHHKIRSKIIFVTAYDSFALRAFEVNAVDYLLKPFDERRFAESISRATQGKGVDLIDDKLLTFLKESIFPDNGLINIPEGNKNHMYRKNQILFVQSDRYYVYVSTKSEKRLIRITLKKMEDILPSNFLRINKSTIVNTDFVTRTEYLKQSAKILMEGGEIFNASRTYYSEVKEFFSKLRT
ncbi:MAG: LytTR family DNA-binding domain-containing protein [Allomuricauda sp.]